MTARKDYTGMVFGSVTTVRFAYVKKEHSYWEFMCFCGNTFITAAHNVARGNTKSCGCLKRLHGMADTRPANIHHGMKDRCDNPSSPMYRYYGGKGVTYPENWKTFKGFWEDMANGYSDELTLDRIDPSLPYSKENCKWSTCAEQVRNRGKMKNNTSGVTGVWFSKTVGAWNAYWRDLDSRGHNKSFSIKKYGDDAFILACEYRAKMIEELNKQGAGYSPSHGL